MSEECEELHKLFDGMKRFRFPFNDSEIPKNGIYILFEKGEKAHDSDRIVRIGTHTGRNQLRNRLREHFVNENKDRSIFRKNIGRCILNGDDFINDWELTPLIKSVREAHPEIDFEKQKEIEKEVTKYIQDNFSFVVFEVPEKEERLRIESKIISTVSRCKECHPSKDWFGLNSPKEKIRESGLWLVNELYKEPFSKEELREFMEMLK